LQDGSASRKSGSPCATEYAALAAEKMYHRACRQPALLAAVIVLIAWARLCADEDDNARNTSAPENSRYGLFGLFDHRSAYGRDVFPEPLLVDDTDREDEEVQVDWFHAKTGSLRSDTASAQFTKGFGLLSLELTVPFVFESSSEGVTRGIGSIGIGARHPLYQYVSAGGFFDMTLGAAVEAGIPTHSSVSRNTEFVPKFFNDMRFGSHVTLQSVCGYSKLFGPGEDSGLRTLDYGMVLAVTFQHEELPLPGIRQFSPLFEISGEKQLNHEEAHNGLLGDVGFRANLKPFGGLALRLGVGYVFPMNQAARAEVHHGIYTSVILDF
jgi:hypothetical protein